MSVHVSVSVPAGALITRDTEIGRTALVRWDGELPHGRHRMVVGELLSTQGHRLTEPFDVPFTVGR
ncbi:hypothetical protein ACU635_28125 [[Actinomadura] parvosata]|uniref:hypothetical protein n=1 Tax=[Actinomadura] parvosata TaxID=1955412 RepID=UPI00406CC7E7